MMEELVYQALLQGNRFTFNSLVRHIMDAPQYNPNGRPKSWEGRALIGKMIANREISISDDGRVHIS